MREQLKKITKPFFYVIFSVYVLSIPIKGKTLYSYARGVLVDNSIVSVLCEHGSAIYEQVSEKVRLALVRSASKDKASN